MLIAVLTSICLPLKKATVFFVPFLAIFMWWSAYSFVLGNSNNFVLAEKISELLMLGGNPYLLVLTTGIIGGAAAGISGILGKQIVNIFGSKLK